MKRKSKQRIRYFAYGSNLLQERLERRVGRVSRLGTASIGGYDLKFNCGSKQGISFANITKQEGSRVSGVIYLLTRRQMRVLDMHEGLYDRHIISVNDKPTVVYISYMRREDFFVPPAIDYIKLILAGYRENKLGKSYQKLRDKIFNRYGVYLDG